MKGLNLCGVLILILISNSVYCVPQQQQHHDESYERVPVLPPNRRPIPPTDVVNSNHLDRGGWSQGLMQSAKTFAASPAGQLAMSMAKEYIGRSYGGNQVLSLNLPSLLILVLLKALIFTTGLFGAGNFNQYGRGRVLEGSFSQDSLVSNAEMQLYLGFLAAEGSSQDACLYRAACMAPEQSSEYLKAGRALLSGYGIFDP